MAAEKKPKTVLVVDDNASIREMIGEILLGKGFRVVFAEDPIQGGVMARRELPNMAILDFQMPGGDGGTLYETFRAIDELAEIPILFVSGSISMNDPRMTRILSMDARAKFLPKPFGINDLCRLVEEFFPESKPRRKVPR